MMKKTIKIASVIVSLMLCISLCTFNVFAEPDEDFDTTPSQSQIVTEPLVTIPDTEPPTPAPTQPPVTQPPVTQPPATQAPVTQAPATQAPYYSSSSTYSYSSNDSSYYSSKSSALSSPTKAPTAAVYDVEDRKIDTDTLKKKDWDKIAEKLKNANSNDDGSAGDFDFIQKDDGSGDNGDWILYAGIAFEAVGIAIVITLIVLAVRRKKKLKNGRDDDRREPPRGGRPAPRRASAPQRVQQPATKGQVKRRSKYDTAEIYIPKNAPQRGGRRYKPKH